jgi:hypothetical protein
MKPYGVVLATVLSALFLSDATQADALTDVRATLQKLSSDAPIKGTLDVRSEHLDQEENDDHVPPGHLRMHIEANGGLSIHLDPDLLQLIEQEQKAHDADANKPTPDTDLLRIADAMAIGHLTSAAPALLQLLEGATGPEVAAAELDGAPVQQLTVQIPLLANKKYRAYAYGYKGSLVLWLDAQGVPLASQQNFHAKFCKFFFCLTVDQHHDTKLKVVNGRLVAVSAVDELQQSGLGQGSHTKQTFALQLDIQ